MSAWPTQKHSCQQLQLWNGKCKSKKLKNQVILVILYGAEARTLTMSDDLGKERNILRGIYCSLWIDDDELHEIYDDAVVVGGKTAKRKNSISFKGSGRKEPSLI